MSDSNQLQDKQQQYQKQLSKKIKELSGDAEDLGKKALMIAGGVFVAYQLVKLFTGSKAKTKVYRETSEDEREIDNGQRIIIKRETGTSGIFDTFKAEMGGLLLAIAKDKILEFISQIEVAKNNAREQEDTE